ncbi:MAG TPA: hypothetical protein VFY71_15565 [Planctomycetota bacterium]|nr:hypothetical protein [Planctomycetota bacterium]
MDQHHINYLAGVALVVLSFFALGVVLADFRQPTRAPVKGKQPASPLFEMSVLVLCVVVVVFLSTADWDAPQRAARPLAYCGLAIAAALGAQIWQRELR